ncbi:prepilin peptidase [Chamaesiphon sp. VAR_69_metabat_338]|uniref:prepilin peptidase n=1 Tax=Chamaesiphon sp. VAR_69_metabat_338 TaxID=2964704 RepID=UPI00286DF64F|nr:prepilin peptidase [Chamaesiphon sp. VAR_69_metabat_338]
MNIYDTIVQVIIFWLGAAIGSFLNVVVYRIPAGLSILWPPSRCPKCFHQLGLGENIPILGWLLLRGKCRHCKTPISPRYPIVEAITAIIFVLVYNRYGLSIQTVGYSLLMCWLFALTLIDLDTMTLPNSLTQSGLVLGLTFQYVAGYLDTNHSVAGGREYLIQGILGMLVGIWLYDTIAFVGSIMMGQLAQGGGDAKLMATIGAWSSWKVVLLAGGLASVLAIGGFIAVAAYSAVSGRSFKAGATQFIKPLPFGPAIALGGTIALFRGDWLIESYLQLMRSPDRYLVGIPVVIFLLVLLVWTRRMRLRGS